MGIEYRSVTNEEFSTLPMSFFLSIDRRIAFVEKVPSEKDSHVHAPGYRLRADYGKESYFVRLGLAHNLASGEEVLVIWHRIVNIANGSNFDTNYQKISEWWRNLNPNPLFTIGLEKDAKMVLLGIRISSHPLDKISTKSLISRLIEIIPTVEATAKEISSGKTVSPN